MTTMRNMTAWRYKEQKRKKKKRGRLQFLKKIFSVEEADKKPSKSHKISDMVEAGQVKETLSCFLWQRSIFYDKAGVDVNAWQLRWFTFDGFNASSVPDRFRSENYRVVYPPFCNVYVDEHHLLIHLQAHGIAGKSIILLAPTRRILDAVVARCEKLIDFYSNLRDQDVVAEAQQRPSLPPQKQLEVMEDVPSLVAFPWGTSCLEIVTHCVMFPVKVLVHFTIPDVRTPGGPCRSTVRHGRPSTYLAMTSSLLCVVWMIVFCYTMCASLEAIGELLNISTSIMGITVSAAGTSIPILIASMVAARQGLGNMAVSSAIGSNTFSILIGLGLPWNVYTTIYKTEYHGLVDDGIADSVFELIYACVLFVIIVWASGWMLYRWHAYLFLFMYAVFLIRVIYFE
mmetsp:Transcript_33314/g.76903  ORF Transcript_33314/g.76903 Transcript_33314/m.76903 type:complete len:399 (-) Transcript_33314:63-1259(-)